MDADAAGRADHGSAAAAQPIRHFFHELHSARLFEAFQTLGPARPGRRDEPVPPSHDPAFSPRFSPRPPSTRGLGRAGLNA